jgi:hypothetical protein
MNPRVTRAALYGLVLAPLVLGGCATSPEGPYRFSDGWREAKVVKVVAGGDISRPRFWECIRKVPEAQRFARTYVELEYRRMSRHAHRLVPLPAGLEVQPGEKVHVNVSTCENALVKWSAPPG